jgi:hypothetical protein
VSTDAKRSFGETGSRIDDGMAGPICHDAADGALSFQENLPWQEQADSDGETGGGSDPPG